MSFLRHKMIAALVLLGRFLQWRYRVLRAREVRNLRQRQIVLDILADLTDEPRKLC